jgi:hypothetical protein
MVVHESSDEERGVAHASFRFRKSCSYVTCMHSIIYVLVLIFVECLHSAFEDPTSRPDDARRQSIELRCFAFF